MSDETELLTGRAGNEAAQGFEPMPVAHPAPSTDDLPTTAADSSNWLQTEDERRHHLRPAPPEPEVREYRNVQTGESIAENQTVSAEQAAHDVGLARESERAAREQRDADDLRFALDQLPQDGQPPQQSAEDLSQPPVDGLQPEAMDADAARAQLQAAEAELAEALKSPVVREALERDHAVVRQQAASEVERAHALASAAQNHYATATNNLVGEANALLGVLYPELNGLNPEQIKGALTVMAQQNPQRVQALQQLASRAAGLVEAQARQQHQAAQGQALQRDAALERYTSANAQAYESWSARENPETMKSIRANIKPTVEKYGVPFQTLMDIHTGKTQMGATEFVRSAAFQKMLHDSIKYNLAARGVTEARSNPIPRVQRPGANVEPRGDEGSYATLERNLRGKDLNPKQAADLLIAHRARR